MILLTVVDQRVQQEGEAQSVHYLRGAIQRGFANTKKSKISIIKKEMKTIKDYLKDKKAVQIPLKL